MNILKEFGIKKVIIHGGISKTGSTAIQSILEDSYKDLVDHKILYPKSLLFYEPLRTNRSSGHYLQLLIENKKKFDIKLSSEMKLIQKDITTLLFSTENFYELLKAASNVDKLNNFLKDIEVELIIYLRNQVDWLESQYREDIIGSWRKTSCTIEDYVNEYLPVNLNYYEMLTEIEDKINFDKVSVFDYDKEKHNIIEPLLNCLNVDFEYKNQISNNSVDTATVLFFRALNNLNFNGLYRNVLRKYFSEVYQSKRDNYTLINPIFSSKIVEKYNVSNQMLGIQYFNNPELYKEYITDKQYYLNKNLSLDVKVIEDFEENINQVINVYSHNSNDQKIVYKYIENQDISNLMKIVHNFQHSKIYKIMRPGFAWMKR